jgi:hypothetical protein
MIPIILGLLLALSAAAAADQAPGSRVTAVEAQRQAIAAKGIRLPDAPTLEGLATISGAGRFLRITSSEDHGVTSNTASIEMTDGVNTMTIHLFKSTDSGVYLVQMVELNGLQLFGAWGGVPNAGATTEIDLGQVVSYSDRALAHVLLLEQGFTAYTSSQVISGEIAPGVLPAAITGVHILLLDDGGVALSAWSGTQIVAVLSGFSSALLESIPIESADRPEDRLPGTAGGQTSEAPPPGGQQNQRPQRPVNQRLIEARNIICEKLFRICLQGQGESHLRACEIWLRHCGPTSPAENN